MKPKQIIKLDIYKLKNEKNIYLYSDSLIEFGKYTFGGYRNKLQERCIFVSDSFSVFAVRHYLIRKWPGAKEALCLAKTPGM